MRGITSRPNAGWVFDRRFKIGVCNFELVTVGGHWAGNDLTSDWTPEICLEKMGALVSAGVV